MKQQIMLEQMDHICEEYILEAEQRPVTGRSRRPARILRAALIAACACVVLVGTAFAVEAVTGSGVIEYILNKSSAVQSGDDRIYDGYVTDFSNTKNYPIEAFSEEIRNLDGTVYVEHDSWESAEQYLGLDLMTNKVLADSAMRPQYNVDATALGMDDAVHCYTRVNGVDGQMYLAFAEARYAAERPIGDQDTMGLFSVKIATAVQAEHPIANEADNSFHRAGLFHPSELVVDFLETQYTAPSGLIATIVTTFWESGSETYEASFALNGISFRVSVGGYPYNEQAKTLLIEILDAFEF